MIDQIEPNVDMPVIRYGGIAYPVLFAAASIKRWGEYRGQSFAEACNGIGLDDLSDEDLRAVLRIILEAGERRRRLFSADEHRAISDGLLENIIETYHLGEIYTMVLLAWNQPPGRAPDPPTTDPPPTGETFSD